MSFSSKVKKELSSYYGTARHCNIAEIAGIINTCGTIKISAKSVSIKIQTENAVVAKKYFTLIKKTFNINCVVSIRKSRQLKRNRLYCVTVNDYCSAIKLLSATGIMVNDLTPIKVRKNVNPTVIKSECCKRAYIRGAFISGGSLSDPEKSYHLEFINTDGDLSNALLDMINFFGLRSKIIYRKGYYVVYLKEGENIVDLLNIMGAHLSLMDLENVRIVKDMRNTVNRIVNCETANLSKTVCASIKQVDDINFIFEKKGSDFLSEQLLDVAKLRLMYPEASLKEIGAMLSPSVGKSGVNHRLRKISMIAENLRGGLL